MAGNGLWIRRLILLGVSGMLLAGLPAGGPAHAAPGEAPAAAAARPPGPVPPGGAPPGFAPPPAEGKHDGSVVWTHYRIGDSPLRADGVYEWTLPESAEDWRLMPPDRTESGDVEYAWFFTVLHLPPENGLADPYLSFSDAHYEFEVFAGAKRLFSYGDPDDGSLPLLDGRPVFVPIAGYVPGEPLFLRVHSRDDDVIRGKLGPVLYGNQADLKLALVRGDLPIGVGAVIFFVIGFVSLLMYIIDRGQPARLIFSLFSLLIAANLILSMDSLLLYFDLTKMRMYAAEPIQGGMAWMFALYFARVVRPAAEPLIRAAGAAVFATGALYAVLKLFAEPLYDTHRWELEAARNLGFSLLYALCLVSAALSLRTLLRNRNADAKWFLAGASLYLALNTFGHPLRLMAESDPDRYAVSALDLIRLLDGSLNYSLLFGTVFFGAISFRQYAKVSRQTRERNALLADWNAALEEKVRERTEAIQNLLDHAGQGFLTIDRRLAVQPEHSAECRRLFHREIAGAPFAELLHPDDPPARQLLAEMLESIFQADDLQRDVFLSLLPGEAVLHGRHVTLQYKWIPGLQEDASRVMAILTDITEKRQLESRMEKESQALQMVVGMIKYYRDFRDIMEEYREFAATGIDALLRSALPPMEKWAEISRIVHTFKGNFAQIEFVRTANRLHELEHALAGWKERFRRDGAEEDVAGRFGEWLKSFDLPSFADEDLRLLRDVLGDRFEFAGETVAVELKRLRRLERKVHAMLPFPEAEAVAAELRKLRFRPFRDLLAMYPDYTMKLARSMGKEIHPFRVEGGETLVDPEWYSQFTRTLIHVFRNMVDHGIEPPEHRAAAGKDPKGTISCRIDETEEGFRIVLSNDGTELNLAKIRERALQRGIRSAGELEAMDEREVRMLIFHDGFSTKRAVSAVSGRGFGMSAVREALETLNGTADVASSPQLGTQFIFNLPRRELP